MKKRILIIPLIMALFFSMVIISGCNEDATKYEIITKIVMIENPYGNYTKAEIIIPVNYEDSALPLVTLGHGFHGGMNSAGAEALAMSMAKSGIATIRMDYSHYTSRDLSESEQTNQYTVGTMAEDQLLCIKYMADNYNIDITRIGLYARSLGGRVAMNMANKKIGGYDYKSIVLVAPAGNKDAMHRYTGGEKKWNSMIKEARKNGFTMFQGIKLTPDFFYQIDEYVPSEAGNEYKGQVLVIYNTLDNVVLPKCSLECAKTYKNVEILKVTSEGGHGYEMNYKKSKLKDMLIDKMTTFFSDTL